MPETTCARLPESESDYSISRKACRERPRPGPTGRSKARQLSAPSLTRRMKSRLLGPWLSRENHPPGRRQSKHRGKRGRQPLRLWSSRRTRKFVCELITYPSVGIGWRFRETPAPTGWKPSVSCCRRPDVAKGVRPCCRWCSNPAASFQDWPVTSNPGTHCRAFSSRRLMENGFATSPRTPGSFNNSWARSSFA